MDRQGRNKGFTLVEMMVVIAIAALLTVAAGFSYSIVSNADVRKAAETLATSIREARTVCMSNGMEAGTICIYKENGSLYAQIGGVDGEITKICNSLVDVEVMYTNDYTVQTGGNLMADGDKTELAFTASGVLKTAGYGVDVFPNNKFFLTRGKKKYEVFVYIETGKIQVNAISA